MPHPERIGHGIEVRYPVDCCAWQRTADRTTPGATARVFSIMGTRTSAAFPPLLVSLTAGAIAIAQSAPASSTFQLPDSAAFLRLVREAVRQDDERLTTFTYLEKRRDVRVSMLGKVTVGPERTFEVFPSRVPGATYKRLIAVDGQPLTPEELAKRDAERQREVTDRAKREAKESPSERRERLDESAAELAEREKTIDDAFAVFEATWVGRETLEGVPVVVASLTPRKDANVSTREGRWMKHFAGRAWFDEATHQLAKIDMQARDDISIGWGIVGRIHEKTRIYATRKRIGEMWMPSEFVIEATGRTLLFRAFEVRLVTNYSDYKQKSTSLH
jgi:hypothetical protein